ncbi:MAG TPA: hypothetical protein PLL28_11965 [Chitinophagales bacterium]|nr:hypothetical protein [Chitinophagales bacterium]HNA58992.1 hypothetical protein [Chitinophagales bacterium]HNF70084.1 hypothetical protein [Chitinophagales bacterium]
MKHLLSFFAISLFVISTHAQDWEVPRHYMLEGAEDYVPYEADIIQAANWLRDVSPTTDVEKFKEASQFVIKWVNGSPTVTVEINKTIMEFNEKNHNMLVLYMASCAKYVLENNYSKDVQAKHISALKDMAIAYQKQPQMQKDKKMEKLVKAIEEGTADDWYNKNFK